MNVVLHIRDIPDNSIHTLHIYLKPQDPQNVKVAWRHCSSLRHLVTTKAASDQSRKGIDHRHLAKVCRFLTSAILPLPLIAHPHPSSPRPAHSRPQLLSCQSRIFHLDSPLPDNWIGQDSASRWTISSRGSPPPHRLHVGSLPGFSYHPLPDLCATTFFSLGCRGLRDLHPSLPVSGLPFFLPTTILPDFFNHV